MKQLDPMVVGQQLFSNLGHIHTVKYSELTGVHSVMIYVICMPSILLKYREINGGNPKIHKNCSLLIYLYI